MKRHLIMALALLTVAGSALAAAFDYGLKARRVADGVYAFIGHTEDFDTVNGGNIANAAFIVAPGGVIVVDSGSSLRYGRQMRAAIAAVTDKPVALVINTHHHPDHFLGNQAFPAETLAALPTTRRDIQRDGETFNANMYRMNGDWMLGTEVVVPGKDATPGRQTVAGRDIELIALGGHTAADLVVLDHASGTVFAADLIFNRRAPTTPHADLPAWIASLQQLETLPARQWVPGHGEVANDLAPLRETRAYLTWLGDTMRAAADQGLDMTEVFATPIPERFRDMALVGSEFRRSVTHLFPAAEQAALAR